MEVNMEKNNLENYDIKNDPFYTRTAERKKSKEEKKAELFSSTDYFEWFTEEIVKQGTNYRSGLSSYYVDRLNPNTREMFENTSLLYQGIDEYAKRNYLYPTECDFGTFYRLKYKDAGYIIGFNKGGGPDTFFCYRNELEERLDYIDFVDIVNNYKYSSVDMINRELEHLSSLVSSLYDAGVPYEALNATLTKSMNEIRRHEEYYGKKKVLK